MNRPRRMPFEGIRQLTAAHGTVQELRAAHQALNLAHRAAFRGLGAGDEATVELGVALAATGRAWDSLSERLGERRR